MSLVREHREALGYVVLGVVLAAFLVSRVQPLDSFFLDEWMYVHGAEYMWDNFPLGAFEVIPEWNRGPQRLYTVLLAGIWGPFATPTAFALSHLMNVALLVSAIWPAALLARRVIDEPLMRVLAVALAVAVPWLLIAGQLLNENLAFPLFLWTVYAILEAAERPGWWPQIAALGCIAALTLCRLNLAVMLAVFVLAVVWGELRNRDRASSLGATLRRRLPTVIAVCGALVAVVVVVRGGGTRLGAYGGFASSAIFDAIWGSTADASGRSFLTYFRGLAAGCFVFPLVLGLAGALAAARGRLGARSVIPGGVALASFVTVLAVVAVWTGTVALEERYVFYAYAPLAILAVASVRHLSRMLPDLVAAGAALIAVMAEGGAFAGDTLGNFFAAPAGAFWTRVVDHRLRSAENEVLGFVPGAGGGWLLIAIGVAALVVVAFLSRRDTRLGSLVAAGLACCALGQVLVLEYGFDKLLYGTTEAPGGFAIADGRSHDDEDWVDDALPDGAHAAIMPALATWTSPYGDTERQQFWNKSLDASVVMRFAFVPTSVPPGFRTVDATVEDGIATWQGPHFDWLVAQPADPRLQFNGREVARSDSAPLALFKLDQPPTAAWTAQGVDSDGAVIEPTGAVMTLNRATGEDVRAVELRLRAPPEIPGKMRWRIARTGGRRVASGTLAPGAERTVRLRTADCRSECANDSWHLTTKGAPAYLLPPFLGTPPPARRLRLFLTSVALVR